MLIVFFFQFSTIEFLKKSFYSATIGVVETSTEFYFVLSKVTFLQSLFRKTHSGILTLVCEFRAFNRPTHAAFLRIFRTMARSIFLPLVGVVRLK